MNKAQFLPNDFSPPNEVITSHFILVPLAPEHNELDFDAWTSSIPELKGIFGPSNRWPEGPFRTHR